ncbi:MAG: NAD(P)/FAD-dependent oxidoreductase, partial [Chloroflexota bacterium]|nr:NAD(P)/FAD-dependent oxidoreductase [Chloroflexota bacterium]
YTWDRFYHVTLLSDHNLRGLLDELGLSDQLRWGHTRTGFYTDGTLYSLSTSLEFLTFPPLSLIDKARLAATILYASRLTDWRRLEGIPVAEWLRRLSGQRTFERIWLPLLKSKLGENYRLASAAFIWAIIARMYAARRSGLKREMFGYVEGGYDTVLRRLRSYLEHRGIEILCGRPAAEIQNTADAADVYLVDGVTRTFDKVVVTVPCARIPALCPQLTSDERSRLAGVVYQGIACASLLLRKPLAGFYVTNITDSWVPFTAVIEMTALVDRSRFGGNTLIYLPRYLTQDDPFWQRSDDEIRTEFLAALERMYPHFRREDVLAFHVARVKEVLAVSTLHYSDTWLPPLRTSLENVFVVNSAQIANGTLNVNETIGLANAKAAELAPLLKASAVAGAPA